MTETPMWTCPTCGQRYVTRNTWHSCQTIPWEQHFEGRPLARQLFGCLREVLEASGPVEVFSTRSRLGFMTRVRFCGAVPRRDGLRVRIWLKRELDSPRFASRRHIGGRDWNYEFIIRDCADLDEEAVAWLDEARWVGDQRGDAGPP